MTPQSVSSVGVVCVVHTLISVAGSGTVSGTSSGPGAGEMRKLKPSSVWRLHCAAVAAATCHTAGHCQASGQRAVHLEAVVCLLFNELVPWHCALTKS